MSKIGAMYVRVSTDMQTEYSPDSQIKLCKKYADDHDIEILPQFIFEEDGISGTNADKRPQFQKMISIARSKPKPFDCILVYDFSRFARNKDEAVMYKTLLRKKLDIEVISITQPLSNNKDSIILESMYEAMDQYYSMNLSDNVKRGKNEKASRGEYQGATPFGYVYTKDGKSIIPDDNTSKIVRYIFEQWAYNDGSLCGITKSLNNKGIKTARGNNWNMISLWYLINNPLYAGYTRHKTGGFNKHFNDPDIKVVKGKHQPIISAKLWEDSQKRTANHNAIYFKYMRPSIKHEYWLRGIIKCSNCGGNMIMIKRHTDSTRQPFYQCSNYNKKKCKESHSISCATLEKAVLNEIERIYKTKINIDIVNPTVENDDISITKDAIDKSKEKLVRIENAYIDGIDSLSDYKIKKTRILSEIDRLNSLLDTANIKKIENDKKQRVYSKCDYAHRMLIDPNVDFNTKSIIAHQLFEKIVYNKKDNALYITFKNQ